MSRYWNDSDWSDYEGKSVGWELLLLHKLIMAQWIWVGLLSGVFWKKNSRIWLAIYDRPRVVGLFVVVVCLLCVNSEWFFNRWNKNEIAKIEN